MEAQRLVPCDIEPLLEECLANINDDIESSVEQNFTSHVTEFTVGGDNEIRREFIKANSKGRNNVERERTLISLTELGVSEFSMETIENCVKQKKDLLNSIKVLISFSFLLFL